MSQRVTCCASKRETRSREERMRNTKIQDERKNEKHKEYMMRERDV